MASKPARIQVRLRELSQLFNSMDPSPFFDRDLDADAEEFIVSWAREFRSDEEFELVIHLATAPAPLDENGMGNAVRHYFAARSEMKHREWKVLMRRGRKRLLIGLAFLAGCLSLGGLVGKLGTGTTLDIVRESLTILGWVAMWGPLQTYLYDWWPLREEWRLFARLGRAHVRIVLPT